MKVKVCIGTPCHLMGAQNLVSALEKYKSKHEVELEIEAVNCLDNCNQAPAVEVAGEVYAPATPQELIEIVKSKQPSKK